MTVHICDRCGTVTVNKERCICATPRNAAEFIRRHRAAVESARITSDRIHVQPSGRIDPDMSLLAASSATVADWSHPPMADKALSSDKEAPKEIDGPIVLGSTQVASSPRQEQNTMTGPPAITLHTGSD